MLSCKDKALANQKIVDECPKGTESRRCQFRSKKIPLLLKVPETQDEQYELGLE